MDVLLNGYHAGTEHTYEVRVTQEELERAGLRGAPLFGSWLSVTGDLQYEAYGADLAELEDDEYMHHVQMNVTAIVAELGEFLAEFPGWKPWAIPLSGQGRRPVAEARDRAVGELVDVLHFVANLLVGLRCSDLELRLCYQEKVDKNYARMRSGTYDGVTGKCVRCGRAIDDVGTGAHDDTLCRVCDANDLGSAETH